jgi:Sulfotransferase family
MGTVFIHIGVSKTGTTTLQQNVFERLDGILYLGKPGPHERDRIVDGFSKANSALLERTLESLIAGRIAPRDDIETLRAAIEKLKSSNAPVIYSNELLCENKYIAYADIAATLRDIFGPCELLVTVRDPMTALPSAYLHEVMRFPDVESSFSKWLDDAITNPRRVNRPPESLEQYRYAFMLRQFRTIFDGRITILQYEELLENPSAFSRALGRLIGSDVDEIKALLALPPKNATSSELFYLYRRFVNKFRTVFPFLDPRSVSVARKLNAAIERWTIRQRKKSVPISEYDRIRIAQFFPYPVHERDWRTD